MEFLTNDKLVIVGAGGMIGSNMVQSALMLGLTPNICLYDIFEPGVHGVFDEIQQCAFPGANITYTVNPEEAFTGAKYIISSGGAPRKEGMTREDLLKGNCKIAAEFGDNIKKYCPEVEHVVVIFNPADVTALTALIHSGLKPNQLTSLAAGLWNEERPRSLMMLEPPCTVWCLISSQRSSERPISANGLPSTLT